MLSANLSRRERDYVSAREQLADSGHAVKFVTKLSELMTLI
jgi:hypothetical protein